MLHVVSHPILTLHYCQVEGLEINVTCFIEEPQNQNMCTAYIQRLEFPDYFPNKNGS
uniref:Uncharacterized protein n=1 Tax=Arundo donax TaxID=35708 RepID=A0A0A9DPX7_ARUDO